MSGTWQMDNCCGCEICGEDKTVVTSGSEAGIDAIIQPPLSADNEVYWGCFAPGIYRVHHCRGAWEYYDSEEGIGVHGGSDWVVGMVPAEAEDVTTRDADHKRYFFVIEYMSGGEAAKGVFGETAPPDWGRADQDAAVAAVPSPVTIYHSGGLIGISFKDNLKTDNTAGTPSPQFALEYVGPLTLLEAVGLPCGSVLGANSYRMTFTVKNNWQALTDVSIALGTTGGIATASGPVVMDLPLGDSEVTFDLSLTDPDNKAVTATLTFSGDFVDECEDAVDLGSVEFDLTPNLTMEIDSKSCSGTGCGLPNGNTLKVSHNGGLPVERLEVTLTPAGTVAKTYDCAEASPWVYSVPTVLCCTGWSSTGLSFRFSGTALVNAVFVEDDLQLEDQLYLVCP